MKNLKTILVIPFLFVMTLSYGQWNWGNKKVKGNGDVVTETRSTGNYDGIGCAGSMDFILVAGKEGDIKLEGESNLLKHIVTEIKNGKLIVKVEKKVNIQSSRGKTIKVTIPFKNINSVSLAGSGDVISEDKISSNDLKVSLSGSGDMILNVDSQDLKGSLAGSGDITLKGNASKAKLSVAGSGDIHAFNLNTDNTTASIAGSGDIEVNCNGNLKASIAGSGDIEYKGNAEVTKKVAGSGSVSRN